MHLSVQAAIDLPNLIAKGDSFEGELTRFSPALPEGLKQKGIVVQQQRAEGSGLHGIFLRHGQLQGGADSRRQGVALRPGGARGERRQGLDFSEFDHRMSDF